MKRFLLSLFIISLAGIGTPAVDLKQAQESPLNCAIYLTSKRHSNGHLFWSLFHVGRYDDLLELVEKTDTYPYDFLIGFSAKLGEKSKTAEANKFLDLAIKSLRRSDDSWGTREAHNLAEQLAAFGRDEDVLEILKHQGEDSERAEAFFHVGQGYQKAGQYEKAAKALSEAWKLREFFDEPDDAVDIARLFTTMGQKERALEVLDQFEKNNASSDSEYRNRNFIETVPIYIRLGDRDKAERIWQQYRDPDSAFDIFTYASALRLAGYPEKAEPYFLEVRSDKGYMARYGFDVVKSYLTRGDVETARQIAVTMSAADDNYYQQESLMAVADTMLSGGNRRDALALIDLAYQKAKKVGEGHRTQDSIGASPLTRKVIYLRNIRERYFKLGLFEKGLATADWIKINDDHAKEYRAETRVEFAAVQSKSVPRKNLNQLLKQAVATCESDDEYCRNRIRLRVAEVYAGIGEKTRATEELTLILTDVIEYSYLDEFLVEAGNIFEQNQLTADPKMKNILKEIIEAND